MALAADKGFFMEKDSLYSVRVHYELLQHLHVKERSMQSHDLQPTVCFKIEFTDNYVKQKYTGSIFLSQDK